MKIENTLFDLKYSMTSGNGELEGERYVNEFFLEIYSSPEEPEKPVLAGKVRFSVVLISTAVNEEYSLFDVFDSRAVLLNLAGNIYNSEMEELAEGLEEYFTDFIGNNILFLESIEILPEFRGRELGKQVIKDIYGRFSSGCLMFVLKSFPLQCDNCLVQPEYVYKNDWQRQMKYKEMERNYEISKIKLYEYYRSLGFENYLKNEYFFMNPALRNTKLEEVKFDW